MNLYDFISPGLLGLGFVLFFFIIMLIYAAVGRRRTGRKPQFREISAFSRLSRAVGRAVESGQRLHLSLGWGGIFGLSGSSGFIGLMMLQRIARAASISDRPPVATSGESLLSILSQDTLRGVHRSVGVDTPFDPSAGRLTGLTPFAYAAGTLPVIFDEQVSSNVLAGHFGPEVALIADAGERSGALTLAGSDSLPAQAVLYATAQEPLIGEEFYASGAYIQAGPMHAASLRTQDFFRWIIILIILGGVAFQILVGDL